MDSKYFFSFKTNECLLEKLEKNIVGRYLLFINFYFNKKIIGSSISFQTEKIQQNKVPPLLTVPSNLINYF